MKLVEMIMTKNPCYTAGKKITPKGLMLHSVGCSQPKAMVFINNWNSPNYKNACVHGFIDANDGTVYQTLPWDHRGWHGGGSSNNTHIGVEMCEPACIKYTGSGAKFTCSDLATARAAATRTYEAAVELYAMLCKKFNLNPLTKGVIVSHKEGCAMGIASNHGDPEHLWSQLGMSYTMDTFRKAVAAKVGSVTVDTPSRTTDTNAPTASGSSPETITWNFLTGKGLNAYAVAGIMGNLYAESGIRANNVQNSYEKIVGSDTAYTAKVDNGSYTNFANDKAGYGIAQWTYNTRKAALLAYAKKCGKSIGDLNMQLEFLWQELTSSYPKLLNTLKSVTSVKAASDAFLLDFERPANQGDSVKNLRASYAQKYYDANAPKGNSTPAASTTNKVPYIVRVTTGELNIRKGPGTNYATNGAIRDRGAYTIVQESSGQGATKWGKLKSGAGWISLDYCKKV